MRTVLFMLFMASSTLCLAQSDSMFVEKLDGTIRGYPISLISQIYFSGVPANVREEHLVQNVLKSFVLYQNFPNPFNPTTTIQYDIPKAGNVEVDIFDIQGRLVRTLLKSHQQAGDYSFAWDSRNNAGSDVASGTYFCRVLFDGAALTRKLLLIK